MPPIATVEPAVTARTNGHGAAAHYDHPGETAVEIRKPPADALRAYWSAVVTDPNGVDPSTIISIRDAFKVRFDVWLEGALWRCICGNWCFELCLEACGPGPELYLSQLIGKDKLRVEHFEGCKTKHVVLEIDVPAGTVPADACTTLYQVGATFQMEDPCGQPSAVVGYAVLGELQFYDPGA